MVPVFFVFFVGGGGGGGGWGGGGGGVGEMSLPHYMPGLLLGKYHYLITSFTCQVNLIQIYV